MKPMHNGWGRGVCLMTLLAAGLAGAVGLATTANAFDRDSVSNLVLWLKADAGVTTNASGTVTAWADQSVSNNHATLLTGNPALVANVIGTRSAVWFDGNADTLSLAARMGNIRTVFWVINEDAAATDSYRPLLGDSANYDFHRGLTKFFWSGGDASTYVKNGVTYVNGTSVGNGTATRVPTNISVVALVTTGNARSDQVGRDRADSSRAWHGNLAELLVYSHALTSNEQTTVGAYLSNKYGILTTYTPQVAVNATTGVSQVTAASATLNGTLVSTGDAPTQVHIFWGTRDAGTAAPSWQHTNDLGILAVGPFSTNLTGLTPDTTYYYVCRATNSMSSGWSSVRWFRTAMAADPGGLRMKLQFTGYGRSETLVNIPLLIVFSNGLPGFSYADFRSPPWYDLRFTDTNLVSLNYEVERWDAAGSSYVWVQIPALADTNACIYAHWGRVGLQAPEFTTNGLTWSEGFGAVWHCHNAVTNGGRLADSTANRNDAIFVDANASSEVGATGGIAGPAIRLSGDADYLRVSNSLTVQPREALTCEIWARSGTATWNDFGLLMSKRDAYLLHTEPSSKGVTFYCWNPGATQIGYTPTFDITQWHYYAGTYGAAAMRLLMDGARVNSTSGGGMLAEDAGELRMGSDDGYARYLNGWLDEARVSLVARSTNWIWATWLNMASNSGFVAYGPVENAGSKGTVFWIE